MLLWLNGTYGVGKTTLAREIARRDETFRIFDPDSISRLLCENLEGIHVADPQDLAPWRTMVPTFARDVTAISGQQLIVPGTVLKRRYWRELVEGFDDEHIRVFHVVLDADREALSDRIRRDHRDRRVRSWRLDHLTEYEFSRDWMRAEADLYLNTATTDARVLAGVVLAAVRAKKA
jgi:predicted kinase